MTPLTQDTVALTDTLGGIKREQCPRCKSLGRDTSRDNLAIYSDGHKYCYGCGYLDRGSIKDRLTRVPKAMKATIDFPDDFTESIPVEAAGWLRKYGITHSELKVHKIGYSPSRELLIFPIFGEGETIIAWQGRNFKKEFIDAWGELDDGTPFRYGQRPVPPKRKYLTFGPVRDIWVVVEPPNSQWPDLLVVVEGFVDAIKVGRVAPSMPLWGSHMPLETIIRASKRFGRLAIWLDMDKAKEAVKTAVRASQYIPTTVIQTALDPKEYNEISIASDIETALKSPLPS